MDIENMDVLTEFGESTEHTEKEKSSNGSQDELTEVEVSASNNNLRSFKRAKKQTYQKVVESFTKDWKESQKELLETMKEQDEKLIDIQSKKQEEILEKNMKTMEKILENDREENAKMLQEFLSAMQPMQPHVFQAPTHFYRESPSSSVICVPLPKGSSKTKDESA
ncbi:uncharacterized protein LOC118750049 [Rhagoletis pomonella]|uniref:uncharacterized protein LOC118750049 n=1 Tax=Rhagoletis pomonella TaxID=28610 RepID=UPI00178173E2|nr:uncharacterized protein LOC118750049 [Rhagoletis pomonella]